MATGSVVRWLIATALLNRPRRRRLGLPPWLPALLSLFTMLGGFVVVVFSVGLPAVAGWIALGVSIGLAIVGLALGTLGSRVFLLVGCAITALATWTVVASSGIFEAATVRWLALGSGLGFVLESLIGLIAHELSPSRVIHVLEVRGDGRGS